MYLPLESLVSSGSENIIAGGSLSPTAGSSVCTTPGYYGNGIYLPGNSLGSWVNVGKERNSDLSPDLCTEGYTLTMWIFVNSSNPQARYWG